MRFTEFKDILRVFDYNQKIRIYYCSKFTLNYKRHILFEGTINDMTDDSTEVGNKIREYVLSENNHIQYMRVINNILCIWIP